MWYYLVIKPLIKPKPIFKVGDVLVYRDRFSIDNYQYSVITEITGKIYTLK